VTLTQLNAARGDDVGQSLYGSSYDKVEDSKEEHLELRVATFDTLAGKAMRWIASK
jgi:N-carbamoyl-L-amino-acid hydrolase